MTDEAQEVVTEQVTEKEWSEAEEAEAKDFGWKAPEEWVGEVPTGYIADPRRYLERAEGFAPFRKLKEKLTESEKAFEVRLHKIEKVAETAMERQKAQMEAEHKRQLAEVRTAQRAAAEVGDTAEFDRLERKREELAAAPTEPTTAPAAQQKALWDQAMAEWMPQNAWWHTDKIMHNGAIALNEEASLKGITEPKAALAYVDARMREEFPHKFAPKQPQRQTQVSDGLMLGGGKKAGFDSLPQEAKSAFKRFWDRGSFEGLTEAKAKEAYYNEYQES